MVQDESERARRSSSERPKSTQETEISPEVILGAFNNEDFLAIVHVQNTLAANSELANIAEAGLTILYNPATNEFRYIISDDPQVNSLGISRETSNTLIRLDQEGFIQIATIHSHPGVERAGAVPLRLSFPDLQVTNGERYSSLHSGLDVRPIGIITVISSVESDEDAGEWAEISPEVAADLIAYTGQAGDDINENHPEVVDLVNEASDQWLSEHPAPEYSEEPTPEWIEYDEQHKAYEMEQTAAAIEHIAC